MIKEDAKIKERKKLKYSIMQDIMFRIEFVNIYYIL